MPRLPLRSLALLTLAPSLVHAAPGDDTAELLRAELERVEERSGDEALRGYLQSIGRAYDASALLRAGRALDAGALELALRELAEARAALEIAAFAVAHAAVLDEGYEAFERACREVEADVERLAPPDGPPLPGAVQALVDAAGQRARIYAASARPYGVETGIPAGLFYLGTARAEADLVRLARGLSLAAPSAAPGTPGLEGYRADLEALTLARFTQAGNGVPSPIFDAVSARLTFSRELAERGLVLASLDELLSARRDLSAVLRANEPPPALDVLEEGLEGLRGRLADAAGEGSLAAVLLQDAELALEEAAVESSGRAHDRLAVLVLDVLPGLEACLGSAAVATPAAAPRVTVTIVRWPFT